MSNVRAHPLSWLMYQVDKLVVGGHATISIIGFKPSSMSGTSSVRSNTNYSSDGPEFEPTPCLRPLAHSRILYILACTLKLAFYFLSCYEKRDLLLIINIFFYLPYRRNKIHWKLNEWKARKSWYKRCSLFWALFTVQCEAIRSDKV